MASERNRTSLSSISSGYDYQVQSPTEFTPWAVENAFVPGFPYSPEALDDESPANEYPPLSESQPGWSAFNALSQPPLSAPLGTIPFLSGDGLVSPGGWAMETDSDSGDFSPIDSRRPMPELDTGPAAGWSWSQPSSPSFEPESSFTTGSKYNPAVGVPAKANPTPKLRTASRSTRKSTRKPTRNAGASPSGERISTEDTTTPEELRARRNHNLVEKQYRNRLNAQFERLLSVLPTNQQRLPGGGIDGDASTGSDDKRMSKAEVLDVATRRIKELEHERHRLQRERKQLLKNMEMMSGAIPRVAVSR